MVTESNVKEPVVPTLGSPEDIARDKVAESATVLIEGVKPDEVKTISLEAYQSLQRLYQKQHDTLVASQANQSALIKSVSRKIDITFEAQTQRDEFGEVKPEVKDRYGRERESEIALAQNIQTEDTAKQVLGNLTEAAKRARLSMESSKLAKAKELFNKGNYSDSEIEGLRAITEHYDEVIAEIDKQLEEQKQKSFLKSDALKSEVGGGRAGLDWREKTPDEKIRYGLTKKK